MVRASILLLLFIATATCDSKSAVSPPTKPQPATTRVVRTFDQSIFTNPWADHEDKRRALANWQSQSNRPSPRKRIQAAIPNVEGTWEIIRCYDTASLELKKQPDETLHARFVASGYDCSRWIAERKATYENGLLVLDEPVIECCGEPYRELYVVRMAGKPRLLPLNRVKFLHDSLDRGIEAWALDSLYTKRDQDLLGLESKRPCGAPDCQCASTISETRPAKAGGRRLMSSPDSRSRSR